MFNFFLFRDCKELTTLNLLHEIEATQPGGAEEHSAIERLILKHAMRCFGRRGYAATPLRGIAAAVNVTAPLVSYYFKSKENLYSKVAEIVMGEPRIRGCPRSRNAAAVSTNPSYRSFEPISGSSSALLQPSSSWFSMLYGPQEGQPTPDLESLYGGTRQRIQSVFERGIDSGELVPRPGVTPSFLASSSAT